MHSASDPRRCRPCRAPPLSHSSRLAPRTGSSACVAPWYWGVHPTNKSMYPYHIHWYFLMEHSTWLKHWYPAATHDYRSGALWVLPPVSVHGDCLLFDCCSPGETNQNPSGPSQLSLFMNNTCVRLMRACAHRSLIPLVARLFVLVMAVCVAIGQHGWVPSTYAGNVDLDPPLMANKVSPLNGKWRVHAKYE
jgi:hypothetical protein